MFASMVRTRPKKDLLSLGVDMGGTKTRIALVDNRGRVIASHTFPTMPERGPERVFSELVSSMSCLGRSSSKAIGIGVGIAGQVEAETGVLHFAPNLGWEDVPVRDVLSQMAGVPVEVTNDVRAATLGEWAFGAGRGYSNVVCLFVGTGIGGSMILEGRVVHGCTNTAGEFGHMVVVADGRECRCRNRGCLEAYGGGWAIAKRARELIQEDPEGGRPILDLAGDLESVTAATVVEAYREGNRVARQVIEEVVHYLSAGIAGIVNAFNPCLVILGGGVVEGLPSLVKMVEGETKKRVLTATLKRLRFTKASLGGDAGVIGASLLPRKEMKGWMEKV